MINKHRVQRIRNIIYGSIFAFFVVGIVLIIILGFNLVFMMTDITEFLSQENTASAHQNLPEQEFEESEVAGSSVQDKPGLEAESSPSSVSGDSSKNAEDELATDAPDKAGDTVDDDPPTVINSGTGGNNEAGEYVQNAYSPAAYPNLVFDTLPVAAPSSENTLYLTFDNTPSSQAWAILDVLKKHEVKATFFVWWNSSMADDNLRFYRQLSENGHQVGIHSATNTESFSEIYASCDSFLGKYNEIFERLHNETGQKTRLYRLPGGSVTPGNPARQAVLKEIKVELDKRGFLQYDWNASAQDAVNPSLTKDQILRNIENSMGDDGQVVILLHDGTGSSSTVEALDAFIEKYKAAGYSFQTLAYDTNTVSFLDK